MMFNIVDEDAIQLFKKIFPCWENSITKWAPQKDGSVRIELSGQVFFIVSVIDERTWRLETVRSWLKGDEYERD